MFLRVIVVSVLLGASLFIQIRRTHSFLADIHTVHYLIIASIYLLTLFYAFLIKYTRDHYRLAYLQLVVDTLTVTAIIYTTGGIDSIFSFLYILTIINASIILYRKGGYVIASCSSILYGLLLDLHYYDVITPLGTWSAASQDYESLYIFYLILVNIIAFYLVAFLSGYLSEQIRKGRIELKERQKDIITLELLNKSIIDSITSGLAAVGADGRIILFNPAAEKIFGIEAESALGRRAIEAMPFLAPYAAPGSPAVFNRELWSPPFTDFNHTLPDGREIHLRLSAAPLRVPSVENEGTILLFQDITEIKRIEAEMKRVEDLALIGELAAGIAHEIRNPMASISGSIQMLREGLEADDVNSRLMDIVMRETARLDRLVDDFLLFARPRVPVIEAFDLNELIAESLQLFRHSRHSGEKIKIIKSFSGSVVISSDPEQTRQILWNLFLNAAEAMPEGGTLFVTTSRTAVGAWLEVRDTGPGFSPQAMGHLFTPFFTTKDGGSGLGLATVRRVVLNLGGTVQGRNHPQGGAAVTIFFPEILQSSSTS